MSWKSIVSLETGVGIGLLLLILSCVLTDNFWPFLTLLPYAMLPIPQFLCGQVDAMAAEESPWKVTGDFLTGVLVVCIFAMPGVMAHVDTIGTIGVLLVTLANVCILGSAIAFTVWKMRYDNDGLGSSM